MRIIRAINTINCNLTPINGNAWKNDKERVKMYAFFLIEIYEYAFFLIGINE